MKNKTVLKLLAVTAALTLTFTGCQAGGASSEAASAGEAASTEEASSEETAAGEEASSGETAAGEEASSGETAAGEEASSDETAAGGEASAEETESSEETSSGEAAAESAEAEVPAEIPAEAEEDVVSYLTGGAYTSDQVVASVGDYTLKASDVTHLSAYQYYSASYYYKMYGATIDLNEKIEDGSTFGEYLFNYGRDGASRYLAARAKAAEMGIELTEDQTASLAGMIEDNIMQAGEGVWDSAVASGALNADDYTKEEQEAWKKEQGEAYYLHSMMFYGTTPEEYVSFQEYSMYLTNLREKLFGEGGEYALTEADKDERLKAYLEENGVLWGRCILFSTQDVTTDEAKAEIKATAESVLAELEGLTGEELENKFTELQTEYDKSGYTPGEVQRYTNTDSLVDGYYSGLQALKFGEVGMTDETDYGYFVLLREADQPEDIMEEIVSNYETEKLTELLDQWAADYGIKKEEIMADVDLESFFTTLGELQTTIDAVDAN